MVVRCVWCPMAKRKQYDHSVYLEKVAVVKELRKTISKAAKTLKQYDFDTIAFRGMSGALPAIPLALRLKKELIFVRKDFEIKDDNSHSRRQVEGHKTVERYAIVDDLICTGKTLKEIVKHIHTFAPKAKCIGVLLTDSSMTSLKTFAVLKDDKKCLAKDFPQ